MQQITSQQKILLACVAILAIVALALFIFYPELQKLQLPTLTGERPWGSTEPPTQEEIDAILESLAPSADTTPPTQEEIDAILESLAPPADTPQPTQEEIDAILESLKP